MAAPMQAPRIGTSGSQPVFADANAPAARTPAQQTTAASSVAPIGGYQRDPSSGLVLRGRGDAAAANGDGGASRPATAPMDPECRSSDASAADSIGSRASSTGFAVTAAKRWTPTQRLRCRLHRSCRAWASPRIRDSSKPNQTRARFPAKTLKGWRRALGTLAVGAAAFGNPEQGARVSDELFAAPEREAEQQFDQADQRYREDQAGARADARQASIDALNSRKEGLEIDELERKAKESPEDKKLESYVNDRGQQTIIFQKTDGSTYEKSFSKVQRKQTEITSPFEAYAYGTPAERQSAQDFLKGEKKYGAEDRQPGEIEQRYDLFKKDPDAYHAMFGDRASQQEQAQASRMLTYFDKRRKEISSDWSLDEPTKAQQLAEIDQLETPYLDAAGGGAAEQRVTVVSPKGVSGTIPRSQLDAAKKKGYKLAEAQ